MPCLLYECNEKQEIQRFLISFVGVYAYYFLCDRLFISPLTWYLYRANRVKAKNIDRLRESLWKNAAVGTLFLLCTKTAGAHSWFLNTEEYFAQWPYRSDNGLLWYFALYTSYWVQSIDFLYNITGTYFQRKRRDDFDMLIHHVATALLMLFSYLFDFTKVGACGLIIHDISDLILETAKALSYVKCDKQAQALFVVFAATWFPLRCVYYPYNIVYSVYKDGYATIESHILARGKPLFCSLSMWYWIANGFLGTLLLVLALHFFWGNLIIKMVLRAAQEGQVKKDIRSESEAEEDDIIPKIDAARPSKLESQPLRARHTAAGIQKEQTLAKCA